MARTVMVFNHPILKLADTEAGLTTGTAFECQITSALIQAQPAYNTIPATGCAGATQSPGATGYQAAVAYLQDWSAGAAKSLSQYAWDHDGEAVWLELTPDSATPTTKLMGQVYMTAGDFGGTFGDGSAGVTASTWPFVDKPDVTAPAAAAADTTQDAVLADDAMDDAVTAAA